MKRVFKTSIIMFMVALPIFANAQTTIIDSGTCGANLTWKLTSDSTLTISGSGAMDDFYNYAPWYFSYRNRIKTIVINSGATTIGDFAFEECTKLTSVTIPNTVKTIGGAAFYNCSSLDSLIIPNGVTTIGAWAFGDCIGLKSVIIGDSVITIGNSAFGACIALTSVIIGNNVTTIENQAFYYCSSLISVTIPPSVITIRDAAFANCDSLTSIDVDSNNLFYTSDNGVLFNKLKTTLVQYPIGKTDTTYAIPNSVTTIGNSAFESCYSLSSVTIPISVTTIGVFAFLGCLCLTSVTIPNNVTTIGDWAFLGCSGLTSLTIGNSVTNIKWSAFHGCTALNSLTSFAKIPPTLGNDVFAGVSISIPVYIPCGTLNLYKNWGRWNNFTNFIDTMVVDTTSYISVICQRETYNDNNFTNLAQAGVYYKTLQSTNGCDSIICLNLSYYPNVSITYDIATICEGTTYSFASRELSDAGTYYDTLQNVNGCDSIIELTLTVNSVYFTQINDSICAGDTCNFNGKILTKEGIYYDTLQTIFGCDSIIKLTLIVTNVGIVTITNYPLRIYPNPTSGKLKIDNGEIEIESVDIFDVMGRKIYSQICKEEIDINSFPKGVYIMKVYDINKQVSIVKIIKK